MSPLSALLVPFAGLWDASMGPLIQNHWSNLFSAGMNSPTSLLRVRVAILARILQRNRANTMCMCLYSNSLCVCVCVCVRACVRVCMCVMYNAYRGRKKGERDFFKGICSCDCEWQSLKFSPWNLQIRPAGWNFQSAVWSLNAVPVCSLESECSLEEGLLPSFSRDFSLCL